MKRVVLREDVAQKLIEGGPLSCQAGMDGALEDVTVELSTANDILFPAVWLDDERLYDAEVWRGESLILTVPPRSPDVDASFQEHERRRDSR